MTRSNVKTGAIAAFFEGFTYIIGFTLLALYFSPNDDTQEEVIRFFISKKEHYQFWIILIYVLFGLALVFLNNTIKSILESYDKSHANLIFSFGLVWSVLVISSGFIGILGIETVSNAIKENTESAKIMWSIFDTLQNAMGGGVELIGGVWVLLISLAGLKFKIFNRYLHILGIILSVAGIVTLLPPLKSAGSIFGMLQIPWFLWLGIAMWKYADKNK